MNNLQDDKGELIQLTEEDNKVVGQIEDASEDGLYSEILLREILSSYEKAWNTTNDKYEIHYYCTLTTHKMPTRDGNKDVAYLRLEKAVRSKQAMLENKDLPDEVKLPEWKTSLVHTEAYPFLNLQERLNPNSKWKEYLFQSCIAKLVAAGLEYAELLQRMKHMEKEKPEPKLDLVITDKMPAALTPDEEQYKYDITKLRQSENN